MLTPSIFGENLFDEFFDDFFDFPVFDDRAMKKAQKKLYGRHVANMMKTDVKDYYFMDNETYEQIPLNGDILGDAFKFVKENTTCKILSYQGNVFGVEPPMFMELTVTEAEPGVKGDTATGATKPVTLETGVQIKVPLFVNEGDVVKVDTRTGEYLERV